MSGYMVLLLTQPQGNLRQYEGDEYIMQKEIINLYNLIAESDNIVFFGGAGVSTESGIPDFRSIDGLYNQVYNYPPETILSHTFFMKHTKEFYDFYKNKMLFLNSEPNKAHIALSELENIHKLKAVITQNIDGLHQKAGSQNVLELHGSIHRNYCVKCRRFYDVGVIADSIGIPVCECGGIIKPDVVLYEESLDNEVMEKSIEYISSADVLIIGGTSLGVYPAAGLINYYKGNKLVLINKSVTPMDQIANLVIHDSIGEVLSKEASKLVI